MTGTDLIVTEPGLYDGMSDETYHADPVPAGSLSSSGARKLLPPSCPARFDYERRNPPEVSRAFNFGHAAHLLVLGAGPELAVVDAPDWRTKAAREQRGEAFAAGQVPILAAEYEQVQDMAAAIRRHPIAGALFNPSRGKPEQSLFWIDGDTGIWRRARTDWMPNPGNSRLIIPDYKTTNSADPEHIRRAVHNYGYYQQAAWYLDGAAAVGLGEDAAFVFVFQEKTPPYLVTVVELDAEALIAGRELNRRALAIYAECTATGHWPGYSADDIALISLPAWATRTEEF